MHERDPAQRSLSGDVALVTGAGRNIGREIAHALAREGADVAVNVHTNLTAANLVCEEIQNLGGRAIPVAADVSDSEAVDRMYGEIHSRLGPVSILVNNAGIRPHTPLLDISIEEWDWVVGVGLRGAFLCAKAAVADMLERGAGRIVNISGRDGFAGRENRAHGVTVKAGLHGFTKALATELGPKGITANTIVPGCIDTTRPSEWYPNFDYVERAKRIPVQRVGTTQEIARAVTFLVSDAGYINGTALHVNGGESLY